jgi:hypothetical protein
LRQPSPYRRTATNQFSDTAGRVQTCPQADAGLGLAAPVESGLLMPPVSALLAPEVAPFAPPVAPGGATDVDALLSGLDEALCDVLGDVDDFGVPDGEVDADADAPPRSAQLVPEGEAVLAGTVVGCVLPLTVAVLAGCEVAVLALTGGLGVAPDEFAALDELAGAEVMGGLDVFGAALDGEADELATGRHEGPADGCLLTAGVA